MCTMMLNNELNGVELYFESKPLQNIIDSLKKLKFRWNGKKLCWYAKQNKQSLKLAQELAMGEAGTISNTELQPTETKANKAELASLWERVRFTQGIARENKYSYKFVGSNYTGLSTKETAAEVRKHLKQRFPEVKFSVRCRDCNTIDCEIVSSPYDNKKLEYSPELDPSAYRKYEAEHNKELLAIAGYATELLESYNFDDSDLQSDYFHTHFYGDHCDISYNYKQTEQTEAIKNEIVSFRNKLAEHEEQEKINHQLEIERLTKERIAQEKLDRIASETRAKQDAINREIIESNMAVIEVDAENQYMINKIKIAHSNKNNTYAEYEEEIANGEESYSINDMKITRELHCQTPEALELFKNMLLHDFDFITGTGGSYTDNNTFTSMTDFQCMTESERENVIWNLCGIAVYYDSKLQFVIDAQGHSYARYVGITDNAEIASVLAAEEMTEETQNYKTVAQTIEDISTEIIHNNSIVDFKTSTEYKTLLLDKFQTFNITLSKSVIRLVEIEELKVYLYELLTHIDSIQEQFKVANIQQGDKITIISIDDMMGMTHTSRVTFDRYENSKYAQYDDAVKIIFTPENKRKLYETYYHSNRNFLVVAGWVSIPENVLWDISESETGFTCRKSKYGSCDIQQLIDIKNYLIQNDCRILIDRINER